MKPCIIAGTLLLSAMASRTHAQSLTGTWTVEPRASLAWWQIEPHYNHLWATTCPGDPAWQPGEGRSPGYYVDYLSRAKASDSDHDEAPVPLYPRKRVRYVCEPSVAGHVTVPENPARVNGSLTIRAENLISGLDVRDSYARRAVLQTSTWPNITFVLDSLQDVMPGDTLTAVAFGVLELHGVRKPVRVPVRAWREGEVMRVKGQFHFPAKDLVSEFQMSKLALGLGVTMGRWRNVHMGLDVVLLPSQDP